MSLNGLEIVHRREAWFSLKGFWEFKFEFWQLEFEFWQLEFEFWQLEFE